MTLAKRAAVVRMLPPTREKRAQTGSNSFLSNLGAMWAATPDAAKGALMGAGLGGVGGYLSQAGRDEEDRRPWGSALTGALAGGALGGGMGLAAPRLRELYDTHQLDRQIAELEAKTQPGVANELGHKAVGAVSGAAPGLLGLGAYHAHRNLPEYVGQGRWFGGRMVNPDDLAARVQAGTASAADRKFVERITEGGRKSLSETLKSGYGASGGKGGPWSATKFTPGGAPYLRREHGFLQKLLGSGRYYPTGTGRAKIRGSLGSIAAFALPMLLQRMGEKAMPSDDSRQLQELYRQRAAAVAR